jgi:RHS repeat-associated protein
MCDIAGSRPRATLLLAVCTAIACGGQAPFVPLTPDALTAVKPVAPAVQKGQTATLMPNGRWLLLGGEQEGRPVSTAVLLDVATGQRLPVQPLAHARSGHTSTVLPDGSVLVLGGKNLEGRVETMAEVFEPVTGRFTERLAMDQFARIDHSATLLTDGRVLVVGGSLADGKARDDALLWNAFSQQREPFPQSLERSRQGHAVILLPNGNVLIHGGIDSVGNPVEEAEIFDPHLGQFGRFDEGQRRRLQTDSIAARDLRAEETAIVGQLDRLEFIPVIRFSKPIDVKSLPVKAVTLVGPGGVLAARWVSAERGMLLFLHAASSLLPGTDYDIVIRGAADEQGHALAASILHVRTPSISTNDLVQPRIDLPHPSGQFPSATALPALKSYPGPAPQWMSNVDWQAAGENGDDELWIPKSGEFHGKWWSTLPKVPQGVAPVAPSGVTALTGRVLRMNGRPLADVTLRRDGKEARTDAAGFFLLQSVRSGFGPLDIDGTSASRKAAFYGTYTARVEVKAGITTQLPYIIWMPKLDPQGTVRIPSPTTQETVVVTPTIPGLELRIPAGTIVRDRGGNIVTELNITAIPVNQPPFPLPDTSVPVYFTIQPGGAVLQGLTPEARGARLFYPNYQREVPGAKGVFWNYDAYDRGWFIYGLGTVSPDGRQAIPDPGVVITEFTGAMFNGSGYGGSFGGGPCNGCCPGGGGGPQGGKGNATVGDPSSSDCADPVDVLTGQFTQAETDLFLPDVAPISLTRTYRSLDLNRRMFGVGMTLDYDLFLWSATGRGAPGGSVDTEYQQVDLILPSGKTVHYTRTTPGTSWSDAEFTSQTPGKWFASRLEWNAVRIGWDLFFKDGAHWYFPDNAPIAEMYDRFGNQLLFTRSSSTGPITRIDSTNGRWVELTMNGSGMVGSAKDNAGRVVTYDYDSSGRLIKVTNPNGEAHSYEYTADNRMFRARSAKGDVLVENAYATSSGVVTQQTLADLTTFSFSVAQPAPAPSTDLITQITDRRGFVRKVIFDASERIKSSTYPVGTAEEQTTTFMYDPSSGLQVSSTDALGRQTTYAYDAKGNVTGVTSLAGTVDAVTTTYAYDPTFNKIASVTDALSQTTTYVYDAQGNVIETRDPLAHSTTMTYDAQGRLTKITNPLLQSTTFAYEGPDLVSVTDPLGRSYQMFYNGAGLQIATVDPLGNRTQYNYDLAGRPIEVVDPAGYRVKFGYDMNGNATAITDQRGNVTNNAFDALNRLSSKTDALLNTETYTYAPNGLLERVTDREGKISLRNYDSMNRVSRISFGATALTPTVFESTIDYSYDKGNRLTRLLSSVTGPIDYTYDSMGRLSKETTALGSVEYTYDQAGRRLQMVPSGQQSVDYAYDVADRLLEVRSAVNAAATQDVVRFTYDNANRITSVLLRNGVTGAYAYDAAGQISSITYTTGVATVGGLIYDYDGLGRVVRMGGTLAKVDLPLAASGRTYNANNQLSNPGYTYDKNGRLTSNGNQSYFWDARDQLSQITGVTSAQFSYDALGRRTRKSINAVPTQFLYDGPNIIQELGDGTAPTVNATTLTGLGVDEAFGRTKGTTKWEYLTDRVGSTIALSDVSASSATTYSYQPYGTSTQAGVPDDNARAFTGREDDGTGLLYYRARYYDPAGGRFISEDPSGLGGGDANLYRYVGGDPLNWTDPSGRQAQEVIRAVPPLVGPATACLLIPGCPEIVAGVAVGLGVVAVVKVCLDRRMEECNLDIGRTSATECVYNCPSGQMYITKVPAGGCNVKVKVPRPR